MPTPLPPVQANPDLLEMLVKLLLGTDVTDPLGPSPGILGAMVPGAARGAKAALPRVRGLTPELSRVAEYIIRSRNLPTNAPYPGNFGVLDDMAATVRRPFVSSRRVPATTPARARLANPPMAYQEGPEGPVAPSIDLGPGYPAEPPAREFNRKQLAMLDEIKVSMQKLLRSGLPAEDVPRQMLPAEMSADLARRYGVAGKRIGGMSPQFRGNPRNPSAGRYSGAATEARDLGDPRGIFTDAWVLEDLVEEILARFLGRLAPRQRPYIRGLAEDTNRGIVPRATRTTPGGLDYWAGDPGDSRFGQ